MNALLIFCTVRSEFNVERIKYVFRITLLHLLPPFVLRTPVLLSEPVNAEKIEITLLFHGTS
jgi:hypothetical protein